MISAGILDKATMRKVFAWRRAHGGELLGLTLFMGHLDDWPALHYARALLELDEADRYLLLMYAHWAHHCARGTWASYEQVAIRPDESGLRRKVAGQVLPCQVMVPVMVRWALVYEERDADTLWLCRAIPRRWLARGQRLVVDRVPTRFGVVSYSIQVPNEHQAIIVLRLPNEGLPARVKLRLRAPLGKRLVRVTMDGAGLKVTKETVTLPPGLAGQVSLQAEFAPRR